MAQQFFYDEQIRRFLLQFTRIFNNFSVEYGKDNLGAPTLYRVPIRYGDPSRQVAAIIQQNSASTLPATPLMTFHITDLEYDRPRMQEPYHVNKMNVRQRTYDTVTQTYDTTQGNAFTIERLMPVPYEMTLLLEIWTSNTNQKLQLLEQIIPLFNPALEIQSTDNYIDWTSLSTVNLDDVNWSSRTIPVGTDDPIDIAALRFKLPIWISSPAKVKKLGVVEKIIASVFDANGDANDAVINNDLLLGTRVKVTPYNYNIIVLNNQLQVISNQEVVNASNESLTPVTENTNSSLTWSQVIAPYGEMRNGISQVRLQDSRLDEEIVGTIVPHPTDERIMLFSIDPDTLPTNTLDTIDAIIDPVKSGPGTGLPAAAAGTRYLLTDDIGDSINVDPSSAWGALVAQANDIIEYNGTAWTVSFESSVTTSTEYVTNATTGTQYVWDGASWIKSYQGLYRGGDWSLVL